MEQRGSGVRLLALLLSLAALLCSSHGGSDGKHSRKIIIHVPYYVKNHHHTHTVYKYMKGDQSTGQHAGSTGDNSSPAQDGDGGSDDVMDSFDDEHKHHHDDAEFVGHHHDHHFHDEATSNSPKALTLRGEHHDKHHDSHHDHHEHHEHHDHHHHHPGDDHGDHHYHHHHLRKQEQKVREEDKHHDHYKNHHQQHDDEHAHFHTKFVVGANDGELHDTGNTDSSEHVSHGRFEQHKHHVPFGHHEDPTREEQQDHESYAHVSPQNGDQSEGFAQEDKYPENQSKYEEYNNLQSEQRTEETQQHASAYPRDQSWDRFHYEKFDSPKGTRDQRKRKAKRAEDKPRRQKYEVNEQTEELPSSRLSRTSYEQPQEYQSTGHRKYNFNWR